MYKDLLEHRLGTSCNFISGTLHTKGLVLHSLLSSCQVSHLLDSKPCTYMDQSPILDAVDLCPAAAGPFPGLDSITLNLCMNKKITILLANSLAYRLEVDSEELPGKRV